MKHSLLYSTLLLFAVMLTVSCRDDLSTGGEEQQLSGIAFSIGVEEQADVIYQRAKTRAAGESVLSEQEQKANETYAFQLEGGDEALYVHRMPLPFVGIHPGTVHASSEATRAPLSEVAGSGIAFHDSLTIWGYTNGLTGGDKTLFDAITVLKINGFRTACEWPYAAAGTMKFYAISPSEENLGESLSITNKTGSGKIDYTHAPTFTYKVPDATSAQRDLVYGTSDEISIASIDREANLGEDNKMVPMTFHHILTAVRFAQGKMPTDVVIKRITLKHIQNQGTYNGSIWSSLSGDKDYTVYPNHRVTTYAPENVYIDGDSVLFLMPQTLASAQLEVVLHKDGTDHTLTCDISGDVWNPGYTVTYKVTVGAIAGDYYLVIDAGDAGKEKTIPVNNTAGTINKYSEASAANEPNDASARSFTIHSFRNYKNYSTYSSGINNWHNVGWKVAGYADTKGGTYETTNSKISTSSVTVDTEQPGGTQTVDFTMAAQAPVNTTANNHQTILTANNNVTAGFNLSTTLPNGSGTDGDRMSGYSGEYRSNGIYNSANSYIVNAKGTYKFPLVYGNSYQNGNPIDLTGNTIFVDHKGDAIKEPNIIKQVNDHAPINTETITSGFSSDEIAAGITKKVIGTQIVYGYKNDGTWDATNITTELVWQDVNGLFSGVDFSTSPTTSTIGFINFTVSSTTLPGNCVIALKGKRTTKTVTTLYDSGNNQITSFGGYTYPRTQYSDPGDADILWTWHIWCTDEVYPNAGDVDQYYPQYANSSKIVSLKDASDVETSKILPVNLGWVPDNMTWNKYEPREVWVKLTQTGSDQVAYIKLRKEATQELVTGTSTIYQWGRPTALPMKAKLNGASRTIYDVGGDITSTFTSSAINTPIAAIANPTKMGEGWNPSVAYWSTTEKTLYDPSPVGFRLPAGTDFSAFSLTGASTTSAAPNLNMWSSEGANSQGGYFFTKAGTALPSDRYQAKVYLPATGTWTDGYVQGNLTNGYYWTGTSGTYLEVKPNPLIGFINFGATTLGNGYAFPIRPKAQ